MDKILYILAGVFLMASCTGAAVPGAGPEAAEALFGGLIAAIVCLAGGIACSYIETD